LTEEEEREIAEEDEYIRQSERVAHNALMAPMMPCILFKVYKSDSIYMREREKQNVEKSYGEWTLNCGWERCAFKLLPSVILSIPSLLMSGALYELICTR